jgi:hypothetical protein
VTANWISRRNFQPLPATARLLGKGWTMALSVKMDLSHNFEPQAQGAGPLVIVDMGGDRLETIPD